MPEHQSLPQRLTLIAVRFTGRSGLPSGVDFSDTVEGSAIPCRLRRHDSFHRHCEYRYSYPFSLDWFRQRLLSLGGWFRSWESFHVESGWGAGLAGTAAARSVGGTLLFSPLLIAFPCHPLSHSYLYIQPQLHTCPTVQPMFSLSNRHYHNRHVTLHLAQNP